MNLEQYYQVRLPIIKDIIIKFSFIPEIMETH